jgi:hypothetical protein
VNRLRVRILASAALSLAGALGAPATARAQVANNQTDGRDYEALAYLPKDTLVALGYFREASTSDTESFSQSQGIFRAAYILKYGNLAVVPFDALVPVVDATVYAPAPMSPGLTTTLHTSGIGDATYLPTIGYVIPENETTHSYIAATAYITAPTGNYDSSRLVNIGDNRWRIQPQIGVGQRFLKAMTFDLIGNVALYTDNSKFGTGTATVTMKQDPTLGMEAHVFGDLSPTFTLGASYYLASVGQRSITATQVPLTPVDPKQTTQTVRFTFGIHVEKNTGIFLQYNQDVEASGGASIGRFIGARVTHAVFF